MHIARPTPPITQSEIISSVATQHLLLFLFSLLMISLFYLQRLDLNCQYFHFHSLLCEFVAYVHTFLCVTIVVNNETTPLCQQAPHHVEFILLFAKVKAATYVQNCLQFMNGATLSYFIALWLIIETMLVVVIYFYAFHFIICVYIICHANADNVTSFYISSMRYDA